MASLTAPEGQEIKLPSTAEFKNMIAKARIYRDAQKLIRPMFQAFQANITAYTVSVMSMLIGSRIDLDRIWSNQTISQELLNQIEVWSRQVSEILHDSAGGRMISEWAKKPECKEAVFAASYSPVASGIPEVRYES
jgi:AIPR protein